VPLFQELDDPELPPYVERQRIRRAAGWTQARLATHLGVAQRNICNWEKAGASKPTPIHRALYRLALRELERLALTRALEQAYETAQTQK
jgi:transcriptional regulator with XRE-family HTH domain